jgi:hypothetical protein
MTMLSEHRKTARCRRDSKRRHRSCPQRATGAAIASPRSPTIDRRADACPPERRRASRGALRSLRAWCFFFATSPRPWILSSVSSPPAAASEESFVLEAFAMPVHDLTFFDDDD